MNEPRPPGGRIEAVLLDLHSTVLDQGEAAEWIAAADRLIGPAQPVLADPRLAAALDTVWDDARQVDPDSRRDLDPQAHREVFDTLVAALPFPVPMPVRQALYDTAFLAWRAYRDARPMLAELRRLGVPVAVVSNVAHDVRPVLAREGLLDLVDVVVLSFETGAVKPDPRIFQVALDRLTVAPAAALMVGDSPVADGGAAALGIRTLLLPRTRGPVHGLSAVTALVRAAH